MTIHFHSKDLIETGLCLPSYMVLLAYENHSHYKVKNIAKALNISERTIYRIRQELVIKKFLREIDGEYTCIL